MIKYLKIWALALWACLALVQTARAQTQQVQAPQSDNPLKGAFFLYTEMDKANGSSLLMEMRFDATYCYSQMYIQTNEKGNTMAYRIHRKDTYKYADGQFTLPEHIEAWIEHVESQGRSRLTAEQLPKTKYRLNAAKDAITVWVAGGQAITLEKMETLTEE